MQGYDANYCKINYCSREKKGGGLGGMEGDRMGGGYEGVGAGGLESGLIEANHRQQFVDN